MRKRVLLVLTSILGFGFIVGLIVWDLSNSFLSLNSSLSTTDLNDVKKNVPIEEKFDKLKLFKSVYFDDKEYLYASYLAEGEVNLIPNFVESSHSQDIFDENNCKFLINGGFYNKNNEPIGLFIDEGETLSRNVMNNLIDGMIFQDLSGERNIDFASEIDNVAWAMQNGPLLIFDSEVLDLKINDDEYARRSVVMINNNKKLLFVMVTDVDSLLSGPMLKDLPGVSEEISTLENFDVVSALNLDGGNASAFISDEIQVYEWVDVGSVFCVVN